MKPTGERYMPEMQGVIEIEHLSRYHFVHQIIDLTDKFVVDLASGEGYGSKILSQYAKHVIGIDLSSEAIDHATKKYSNTENLVFIEGNASNIPLEDHSVDIFVSFETIEHHDKHEEMMSEIKRVLKSDGALIMSSPDKLHYSDKRNYYNEFHVKELYYQEFKELINNYFAYNEYYFQREFSGVILTIDNEDCKNKLPIIQNENDVSYTFPPMYNLVISSDVKYPSSFIPHFFYGTTDNILTNSDIDKAKNEVFNSVEYLIGKRILKRLNFLRVFFVKRWQL